MARRRTSTPATAIGLDSHQSISVTLVMPCCSQPSAAPMSSVAALARMPLANPSQTHSQFHSTSGPRFPTTWRSGPAASDPRSREQSALGHGPRCHSRAPGPLGHSPLRTTHRGQSPLGKLGLLNSPAELGPRHHLSRGTRSAAPGRGPFLRPGRGILLATHLSEPLAQPEADVPHGRVAQLPHLLRDGGASQGGRSESTEGTATAEKVAAAPSVSVSVAATGNRHDGGLLRRTRLENACGRVTPVRG
jgi:hypothetical protein